MNNSESLKKERSQALKTAHKLKAKGYTFSEAQKVAWKGIRAKRAMKKGLIEITYTKKGGTTTTRTATLNSDILPTRKLTVSTTVKKKTSEKVTYYEISEKGNCFKSFLPQNLVSFKPITAIKTEEAVQVMAA